MLFVGKWVVYLSPVSTFKKLVIKIFSAMLKALLNDIKNSKYWKVVFIFNYFSKLINCVTFLIVKKWIFFVVFECSMINQIKYNFIYVTSKKSEKKTKTSYIYKKNISNTVKITFLIN